MRLHRNAARLAAVLWPVLTLLPGAAPGQAYLGPNVRVPASSVERPGDVGVRAHTNVLLLITPMGGLGPAGGYTPKQLRSAYVLPSTGGSQIVAIVDAFDDPTALTDFNKFSGQFGLPKETSSDRLASTNTVFQVVYSSGSQPTNDPGWELEESLDIEWAHAMAPKAKIILVEAPSASWADLLSAVDIAAAYTDGNGLRTREVSMSWGSSEFSGETAYDSHFQGSGVVYVGSSGDSGRPAIYPSVAPYLMSAGGTTVNTDSTGAFVSEDGWSGSGGGPSTYESRPPFQDAISSVVGSQRGCPDISFDADPSPGVSIYDAGNGGWLAVGGTSVSAPSLSGVINLASTFGGAFATSTQAEASVIYGNLGSPDFRDITVGNNGYPCMPGWDFVTGVGTPQGVGGIAPPAPLEITSLSPSSTQACGPAFTLIVHGTDFTSGAVVDWNAAALTTTYVSPTELKGAVPAAQIASPGTASVTVTSGGQTSNAMTFTITTPRPVLSSINPLSTDAGGPAFTLIVKGKCFLDTSVVDWTNGGTTTQLATTYVSARELKAAVPATLIATPGTASITVSTPGAMPSGAKTFTILTTTIKAGLVSVTRDSSTGAYTTVVSLKNTGYLTASATQVTSATLGAAAASTTLPVSAGSIAPGAAVHVTLVFPSSAGSPGAAVKLKAAGVFTGGTFSGTVNALLP